MLALSLRECAGAPPDPIGRAGAVWYDLDGGVRGRAIVGPEDRWLQWTAAGTFRFRPPDARVDVWRRPDLDAEVLGALFAHEVQPLVLQSLGFETMHGAAVASPAGSVALCGTSGSGKSTLAYALARHGWTQLSDDHLILDFADARPRLRSAPFHPRLRTRSAAHFGHPALPLVTLDETDASRPMAALVIVQQVETLDDWVHIDRIAPATAFPAILPHAHAFDPEDKAESARLVSHYLALVEQIPVYQLRYRPSFDRLDDVVQSLCQLPVLTTAL